MRTLLFVSCALAPLACSSQGAPSASGDAGANAADAGLALSHIQHLVVVIQENHTFDTYFGRYCTAPSGSNPTCNDGPACCEAGPDKDPTGASPTALNDAVNGVFNPDHSQACEVDEINGGKMDKFVVGTCGVAGNFAYVDPTFLAYYTELAAKGSMGDRYFQPIVGASASNDVYLARASFEFKDNGVQPNAIGSACFAPFVKGQFADQTIADLLDAKSIPWAFYAEGYQAMVDAKGTCPAPDPGCLAGTKGYPCGFDPGDVPFAYFPSVRDTASMRDYKSFASDIGAGTLPSVAYVKAIGFRSEHPEFGIKITDGMAFVKGVVDTVLGSPYASDTLILVIYDEGGGYFDHVSPPPNNPADGKQYGTRVPAIAVGKFAKKNYVSHVVMEHSSIVKFIEGNWLGGTGQLGTRDANVNNIGDLLDPAQTGVAIPN